VLGVIELGDLFEDLAEAVVYHLISLLHEILVANEHSVVGVHIGTRIWQLLLSLRRQVSDQCSVYLHLQHMSLIVCPVLLQQVDHTVRKLEEVTLWVGGHDNEETEEVHEQVCCLG